ncbi:MAG: EF2563 family selenium-dependent molybdenum hydroxylase system protein [Spirochaetes bacterium]|uniref:EF2563 family selenium-dependent molybdenum hydroxylase system protein n=1 Tax=Candidatus Ornithospirochaeta stercoripullorum TaxID=2840899 RepID=A0A9D9DZK4_9SPIO|nr:EF2563 family selenium-dependent molybdenum hydroxylase system protein [Candidatus Ornithospirochaeta stercoripullorum]
MKVLSKSTLPVSFFRMYNPDMDSLFYAASELERLNLAFAIVTIIGTSGVTPRRSGRMLVDESGRIVSTIGGHLIEEKAKAEALEAIKAGMGRKIAVNSGRGTVELMIDVVKAPKRAIVIGYGHVGKAISKTLYEIGFALYIYDTRAVECPFAAEVHVEDSWEEVLASLSVDSFSAVIITTHDSSMILSLLDCSKAFYVGVLSSRSRVVPSKGVSVPMGLDIGAETPEEMAVAVAAEILMKYKKRSGKPECERLRRLIIVRGAGDLATGTIIRLKRAGYDVLALETSQPTQVRRNVSFAEAVYEKEQVVDGIRAVLIERAEDAFHVFDEGSIPVLVDPEAKAVSVLNPAVVIDAIIAKKNLGTCADMAPLVIALGPGFTAPDDADAVIETQRGHNLGRIIRKGSAAPNTGIPGNIAGYTSERVIRSNASGVFRSLRTFGDIVKKGETIAFVDDIPQKSEIDGMVRGMLRSGLRVTAGFKIADVDPRGEKAEYKTPSDKAMAIAGSVLEVVDSFFSQGN